jgi:hypothetical protein
MDDEVLQASEQLNDLEQCLGDLLYQIMQLSEDKVNALGAKVPNEVVEVLRSFLELRPNLEEVLDEVIAAANAIDNTRYTREDYWREYE